ncbi:MAG: hypothetical protein ACKV0T_07125 [Planctomycetales bacterium]
MTNAPLPHSAKPLELIGSGTDQSLPEDQPRAWEMIENGRYQPRRIKGSCLGRELG